MYLDIRIKLIGKKNPDIKEIRQKIRIQYIIIILKEYPRCNKINIRPFSDQIFISFMIIWYIVN